jgi:hypothetical protein
MQTTNRRNREETGPNAGTHKKSSPECAPLHVPGYTLHEPVRKSSLALASSPWSNFARPDYVTCALLSFSLFDRTTLVRAIYVRGWSDNGETDGAPKKSCTQKAQNSIIAEYARTRYLDRSGVLRYFYGVKQLLVRILCASGGSVYKQNICQHNRRNPLFRMEHCGAD